MQKVIFLLIAILLSVNTAFAHPDHVQSVDSRIWKTSSRGNFKASFIQLQGDQIQLLLEDDSLILLPLNSLSQADREWATNREASIRELNGEVETKLEQREEQNLKTDLIRKHFDAFKVKVKLRFDDEFFYLESNGMPDHQMMVGITAWQQQVPIPQPYTGRNSWRIPLKPKLSDNPISAKKELFRGAIAIAMNGVPIFNPIKNDGRTDTYLAGELDQFGGHCGRADDYHYHIAPIHLQKLVGKGNPIGYALDGFPLYGFLDSEGKEPKNLDEFNGRAEAGGYRYYSTKKYPYVNGGLRGVVTVREDQIDPQPRANPIRPDGRPLRGAKITDFIRDDVKQVFTLKYEVGSKKSSIKYTINRDGSYDFVFNDANGMQTSETYRNRRQAGKEDQPPPKKENRPGKKDMPPPKKDGENRLPWLAAHFDELDVNQDGFLTLEELKKEIEKTFSAYDKNNDGKLISSEYSGKGPNVKSALAGFLRGHSEEFADSEGVISKESFQSAILRMFERADRRKAGKITKSEASQTGPRKKD